MKIYKVTGIVECPAGILAYRKEHEAESAAEAQTMAENHAQNVASGELTVEKVSRIDLTN